MICVFGALRAVGSVPFFLIDFFFFFDNDHYISEDIAAFFNIKFPLI